MEGLICSHYFLKLFNFHTARLHQINLCRCSILEKCLLAHFQVRWFGTKSLNTPWDTGCRRLQNMCWVVFCALQDVSQCFEPKLSWTITYWKCTLLKLMMPDKLWCAIMVSCIYSMKLVFTTFKHRIEILEHKNTWTLYMSGKVLQ